MLTNKYSKLYYKITSNAKQRTTEGYTELHHIIPQSMGGSNGKENLVEITAREHFICHLLLWKMFPKNTQQRQRMAYAITAMRMNKTGGRYNSKHYNTLKESIAIDLFSSARWITINPPPPIFPACG